MIEPPGSGLLIVIDGIDGAGKPAGRSAIPDAGDSGTACGVPPYGPGQPQPMTTIRISLSENPDGSIHGYGGWVEMDGVRYRVSWDVGPDHRLQDGVTFEALLAAARAGQWLYVDDDNHWRIGD